jgi:hypothetical protein
VVETIEHKGDYGDAVEGIVEVVGVPTEEVGREDQQEHSEDEGELVY